MTKELLEKAKELEERVEQYGGLLASLYDTYYWCKVTVECGNCFPSPSKCCIIPRPIWNQMLEILAEEKKKLEEELNSL